MSDPIRRSLGLPAVSDLRVNDAPLQEPSSGVRNDSPVGKTLKKSVPV